MKGFMKRGVGYRANEFVGNIFRVMRVERQKKKIKNTSRLYCLSAP